MTKNYFTKEQALKIALNTHVPFSRDDKQYVFNTSQILAMMNLAVEVAIGEVVAYQYDIPTEVTGWSRIELSSHKLNVPIDTTIEPLYSVKELEN